MLSVSNRGILEKIYKDKGKAGIHNKCYVLCFFMNSLSTGNPEDGLRTTAKVLKRILKHDMSIGGVVLKQFKKVEREGGSFARLNGSTNFPIPITGEYAWLPWKTDSEGAPNDFALFCLCNVSLLLPSLIYFSSMYDSSADSIRAHLEWPSSISRAG